jgi:flagellar FliL protein
LAKEPVQAQEPAKTGPSKLIVIVIAALVALVLLLGGGLGYFFLVKKGGDSAEGGQAVQAVSKNLDLDEKGNLLPPIYLELKPPLLANLTKGRFKMLQITLQVMTRQQAIQDFFKTNDPKIRHHVLNILNNQDGAGRLAREGKEQLLAEIQAKLVELVEQEGVQGKIAGVYFTKFTME